MRQEIKERNKPNLIIEIEDKPSTRADFLDCLAAYSAQLYKMKKLYESSLATVSISKSP